MNWITRLFDFLSSLFGRGTAGTVPAAAPAAISPAPTEPAAAPAQPTRALTAADYAESFFSGNLAGAPIKPYDLPAGVRGFGPGGRYDPHALDPRYFDAANERILADGGGYVDVRALQFVFSDGSTSPASRTQMRAYLYGLSIDPASVQIGQTGLLAQATLSAPRSIGRGAPGAGQGSFGG